MEDIAAFLPSKTADAGEPIEFKQAPQYKEPRTLKIPYPEDESIITDEVALKKYMNTQIPGLVKEASVEDKARNRMYRNSQKKLLLEEFNRRKTKAAREAVDIPSVVETSTVVLPSVTPVVTPVIETPPKQTEQVSPPVVENKPAPIVETPPAPIVFVEQVPQTQTKFEEKVVLPEEINEGLRRFDNRVKELSNIQPTPQAPTAQKAPPKAQKQPLEDALASVFIYVHNLPIDQKRIFVYNAYNIVNGGKIIVDFSKSTDAQLEAVFKSIAVTYLKYVDANSTMYTKIPVYVADAAQNLVNNTPLLKGSGLSIDSSVTQKVSSIMDGCSDIMTPLLQISPENIQRLSPLQMMMFSLGVGIATSIKFSDVDVKKK